MVVRRRMERVAADFRVARRRRHQVPTVVPATRWTMRNRLTFCGIKPCTVASLALKTLKSLWLQAEFVPVPISSLFIWQHHLVLRPEIDQCKKFAKLFNQPPAYLLNSHLYTKMTTLIQYSIKLSDHLAMSSCKATNSWNIKDRVSLKSLIQRHRENNRLSQKLKPRSRCILQRWW